MGDGFGIEVNVGVGGGAVIVEAGADVAGAAAAGVMAVVAVEAVTAVDMITCVVGIVVGVIDPAHAKALIKNGNNHINRFIIMLLNTLTERVYRSYEEKRRTS